MYKFLVTIILFSFCTVGCARSPVRRIIHLDTSNTINIDGTISPTMLPALVEKIIELNSSNSTEPVFLRINSYGGSLEVSILIEKMLKNITRPVHTISILAASAAFNLAQQFGKRYILDRTIMLTHNAYYTFFPINKDSVAEAENSVQSVEEIYKEVATRLSMTLDEYYKFMAVETAIRGEDNIKVNTADEIIEVSCSKELILKGGCSYKPI